VQVSAHVSDFVGYVRIYRPVQSQCGRALENGPRDWGYAASIAAPIAAYVRCLYQVSSANQTGLSQMAILPGIRILWSSAASEKNESTIFC
jgi:hypothetical protein